MFHSSVQKEFRRLLSADLEHVFEMPAAGACPPFKSLRVSSADVAPRPEQAAVLWPYHPDQSLLDRALSNIEMGRPIGEPARIEQIGGTL
jgi:hypothetical protein